MSRKLYNMLLLCVGDGQALKTIQKIKINLSGHECCYNSWKSLKYWYMDEYQKNEMMAHYETKLKDPYNNRDTSATK